MPKKQSNTSKQTSLFDIRLKNDHDVMVLKGSQHDAASALLSGNIVLSVNEPLTIKKMSLRLYGTIRLNYLSQSVKGGKPTRFEKKIYEYNWDPQDFNKYLNNLYESVSGANGSMGSLSRNQSSSSLKALGHSIRSKSSSNLSHLSSLTNLHNQSSSSFNISSNNSSSNLAAAKSNHVLVQGNYEIPFSAILPGNIPESVEGLPGGSVVYKLEASIDRGKFQKHMITKKHVRVIRTLTTDAVELSETVAVDNTWPKKVEYSLNVPSRAIAIGSGTPISFMLVPLLKGLRLGEIKITLSELYSYVGFLPPSHSDERTVAEVTLPRPGEDDETYMSDKWEVDTFIRVPPSLSKCTQDCDILTHIKVRHKLKFVIGLVNPDGHVSELRASLPVQLFISPFVSISARHDTEETGGSGSNNQSNTDLTQLSNRSGGAEDAENEEEEVIFTSDPHSASRTSLNNLAHETNSTLRSNPTSVSSFTGLVAPPLYEKHIYDRLWSDVSPVESPLTSGTATPRNAYSGRSDVQLEFSMSALDSVLLDENLRQLSIQRQLQESEGANSGAPTPANRATFNLDGEAPGNTAEAGDYFTRGRPILHYQLSSDGHNLGIASPGVHSPPAHISRVPSETSILNSVALSQVPSYTQAIRSDTQDGLLSPNYEPPLPGSNIDILEANRKYEASSPIGSLSSGQRSKIPSRGSSSINIRNALSSNGSSPSNSRSVSYTNLGNGHPVISPVNISRSSSINNVHTPNSLPKHGSSPSVPFSISPGSYVSKSHELQSNLHNVQPHVQPVAQPSSSASNRSAAILGPNAGPIKSSSSLSLHNLHFLNKKKDK